MTIINANNYLIIFNKNSAAAKPSATPIPCPLVICSLKIYSPMSTVEIIVRSSIIEPPVVRPTFRTTSIQLIEVRMLRLIPTSAYFKLRRVAHTLEKPSAVVERTKLSARSPINAPVHTTHGGMIIKD